MDPTFWHERWEHNEIGFHQPRVHSLLSEYWRSIAGGAGQVFVPLCGKSMDMLWLREQGYSVLGVELSPVAVRDFFAEQSLAATTQPVDGFVSSASDGLEILCGDFFDLQPKHLADVRAVYDRAALVALPQALQARYAAHLLALLPQRPPMFLLAFEYEQTEMAGPPFSTTTATVEALFGAAYQIECLFEQDVLEEQPGLRSRGLTRLVEKAYRLTAPP